MDLDKIKTIDLEVLKNVCNVQTFLGFTNFYRQFISEYSRIIKPLTVLTSKNIIFTWTEDY